MPWWLFAVATFTVIWFFTYYGVQFSMHTTALLGGAEMLIMLALAITFLRHPGPGSSYTAPLRPVLSPHHYQGILAGMVFSVLALSGFEAPAPLAQEARRPGKFVAWAVMLSLLPSASSMCSRPTPARSDGERATWPPSLPMTIPYYALGHKLWGAAWWLVVLAIINSAVGAGLACTNAASRVMYTMGQTGTLPAAFGRIHPVHRTPTFAIAFLQVCGFVPVLLVGSAAATGGHLQFSGHHCYAGRDCAVRDGEPRANRLRSPRTPAALQHMAPRGGPVDGNARLVPVFFVTVYPVPAWPYNITPYCFAVIFVAGIGYMYWLRSRDPKALQRGATMLVGSPLDEAGDVDWDGCGGLIREPTPRCARRDSRRRLSPHVPS